MWARTRCPLSSSTRNMALGRGSTTEPSTSIASFFATLLRILATSSLVQDRIRDKWKQPPGHPETVDTVYGPLPGRVQGHRYLAAGSTSMRGAASPDRGTTAWSRGTIRTKAPFLRAH